MKKTMFFGAVALAMAAPLQAQVTEDPFPQPIEADQDVIVVDYVDFATLPDIDGDPARAMLLVTESGTNRMFVSDMTGPLYSISFDGSAVMEYVNLSSPEYGFEVQSRGSERGVNSFAFHPQFAEAGSPGYGKFYTWGDVVDTEPEADFAPGGGMNSHDTVLLEWTARTPSASTYDGGPPRQLLRLEQPFPNHNAGQIGFNPTAEPGDADFGMLYVGIADGGSGGDPMNLSQNMSSAFGKIFRIDPLGSGSDNGNYGIPSDNPFVGQAGTLPEIYAYGVRNPQRFSWDPETGTLFLADIGQNIVEELSVITAGANLGWNVWEGSYRYLGRDGVESSGARGDTSASYPVAEYSQADPLLQPQSAITGVAVYRGDEIPALHDLVIFGDNPSGELFYIDANNLPEGGQNAIRRILLNDGGTPKTLLEIIRETNAELGQDNARRADLRFGYGPDGQILLLNKHDGVIRLLVP